ncbi:hypothetical protein [Priestia abyssalis]|uniref:hypothetical protein n=1 Tax=Priestia abyssalis TaxID=1221450 RepID=UPI0009957346|nr:hypothetical protein [Priestia abyssalis]
MTARIEASCRMSGDRFSPDLLEKKTGWQLERKKEVGELSKRGPLAYGMADLCPPDNLPYDENNQVGLEWVVDTVYPYIQVIKDCGADDVYLDIAVYSNPNSSSGNMVFEPELLRKIANLNMAFWISHYENYDENEEN